MSVITIDPEVVNVPKASGVKTFRIHVARFPVVTQKSASRVGGEENHRGEEHRSRLSV